MMDTADRAILKALAKNARTPIKELAKDAYLSSPAASSRMERLEKGGVILTKDLETFVGHVQTYGTTQTQVVFSTLIEPREIVDE